MLTDGPDFIWKEVRELSGENLILAEKLKYEIENNINESKLHSLIKYILQVTKGDKSIRILDYGSGKGQLITYLRLLGYKNVKGVDIKDKILTDKLNNMHTNLGFNREVFFSYDGVSLPFDNTSFDLIVSQQVIEHVHNINQYFLECDRVLTHGGKLILDFPHRLVPFDTHTRMWFVHYFPISVRRFFYDKYRNNSATHYSGLLNLKPIWFYKRVLNKMFSSTVDMTPDRIKNFTYGKHYEGNIKIRILLDKFLSYPIIGKYLIKVFSIISNATLIVTK
jgi:SAM-dependent methyltransferase